MSYLAVMMKQPIQEFDPIESRSKNALNTINIRKNTDYLGRYYTPENISNLLLNLINLKEPKHILDLGCGTGNLLQPLIKKWGKSIFFAFDIDIDALSILKAKKHKNINIFHSDILNVDIPKNFYDLTISNPPYTYYHSGFSFNFENFSDIKNKKIPSPLVFLDKMIGATKQNGLIAIILPHGILTNYKWQNIRDSILYNYTIQNIVELPPHSFHETETIAHIIIIKKSKPHKNHKITMKKIINDSELKEEKISLSALANKQWIMRNNNKSFNNLGDFLECLHRGKLSSKEIRENKLLVFHTNDFKKDSINIPDAFIKNDIDKSYKNTAKAGDILIARVGRNHYEKIAIVKDGFVEISDSIILIRPKFGKSEMVLNFLLSPSGKKQLKECASGTSAKFITYKEILNLKVDNI